MKNVKKQLALTLAMAVAMGSLAGCGNSAETQKESEKSPASESVQESQSLVQESQETVEELDPVTLKWYLVGTEMEGTADVVEAFNKKLADVLPNTKVEFTFVESYKDNWPLLIAGGEKMDIAWGGYDTPFFQDAVDGNLLPLNDLIQEYAPNIVEDQKVWQLAYASATYEGELYGIPNYQPTVAQSQWIQLYEGLYNYLDVDAFIAELRENTKLTEKMLDLLDEAIQAGIDDGHYDIETTFDMFTKTRLGVMGYMMVGAQSYNMWFDPEAENPEPMHMWEVPETKMLIERLAEWYDKGWISEAKILGQMPKNAKGTFYFTHNWNSNWGNADERGLEFVDREEQEDYYKLLVCTPEGGYVGCTNFGSENSYLTIPYTAENPERAMMLINLLNDDIGTVGNDLLNLICYGFEQNSEEAKEYGWFNYVAVEEEGQMKMDITARGEAESKHEIGNWIVGNTFKTMHDGSSLTTVASREYARKFSQELYPTLKKTALAGMQPDYSSIEAEIGNMASVNAEYDGQLGYGGGGSEKVMALYEEAMSRLNDAGYQKVKAELQSQIDAYMAK